MWQTALLPSPQVTLWGCQGRGRLCPPDNRVNSFVILDSANEAVAAFQPFTMTDGAEPVQVNYITDFPRHISRLFLFVFRLLFCVPMVFQHFFFVHVTGSLTHVTFFTQWISRLISEQNSSLLALLDCQEFPEVKCSLTITSLWCRTEVRDDNGGPPPLALIQDLRNRKGGGYQGTGWADRSPAWETPWDGWGWLGRKHSQYLTRKILKRTRGGLVLGSHLLLSNDSVPLNPSFSMIDLSNQ